MKAESQKVKDSRSLRASKLADAVLEWRRLAEQNEYPRSLHEILYAALTHERNLALRSRPVTEGR